MRFATWTNDINDPSEITNYFAYFPSIESLHSGYRNPRIEELYLKGQEENDAAKRGEMYKELQQIYLREAPIVFLYESPYAVALRKNVKGFNQIPLGNNIFIETWLQK
jgi:peptide/nickel transport system substrate-binding protein